MPYEQQQVAALAPDRGYLDIPADEQADLARRLRIGLRLDHAADSCATNRPTSNRRGVGGG